MKTLQEILEYRNSRVISKFREEYYFDEKETDEIFKDILMWLWLAAKTEDEKLCSMFHSMAVLDKMWHSFLVFSRDYELFCKTDLGKFIHHEPHTREDEINRLNKYEDPNLSFKEISEDITKFQSLVYEELGVDVLLRWFVKYPHIYSPEEMLRRTKLQSSQRGFIKMKELKTFSKDALLEELKKDHDILAYCGGHGCGRYCKDCAS